MKKETGFFHIVNKKTNICVVCAFVQKHKKGQSLRLSFLCISPRYAVKCIAGGYYLIVLYAHLFTLSGYFLIFTLLAVILFFSLRPLTALCLHLGFARGYGCTYQTKT